MRALLLILAILYVGISLTYIWKRPGFFASVCVNSYPLTIFWGSRVGAVFCLLAAFGALMAWLDPKKPKLQIAPGEISLALWLVFNVLSIFVSIQIDYSGIVLLQLIGLSGSMYLVGRTYGDSHHFFPDLVIGCIAGVLVCAPVLVQDQLSAPIKDVLRGRLGAGTGLTPVGLASMMEIPLSGALAFSIFRPNPKLHKVFIGLGTLLLLMPLSIALGTRSLILAAILVLAAYISFHVWRTRRFTALFVVFACIATVAALSLVIVETNILGSRMSAIFSFGLRRITENFGDSGVHLDQSAMERLSAYSQAWRLFLSSPIFGHGIGSFEYLADTMDHLYPHSMLLELLVSTGLAGTLLFGIGCWQLFLRSLREALSPGANWISIGIFGELVVSLARQQVSGSIGIAKLMFLALGIVAARYALDRKEHDDPSRAKAEPTDLRIHNVAGIESDSTGAATLRAPDFPARAGNR